MQIRRRPPNPAVKVAGLSYQAKVDNSNPQNILEAIIWQKEREINQLRERESLLELRQKVANSPAPQDFYAALEQSPSQPAVIAEVKKASPSKGVLREDFDAVAIAQAYAQAGATCLSVLTDEQFFQGSFANLSQIRQALSLPLLCKEFIIYPYQIYLARSHGADAVLLIAAILGDQDLQYFLKIIHKLAMTALIEVHTLAELDRVLALDGVQLIGINNRDLANFQVNLGTTEELLQRRREQIEAKKILIVSESGLQSSEDLQRVRQAGARGVLIGESLVSAREPGLALQNLLTAL